MNWLIGFGAAALVVLALVLIIYSIGGMCPQGERAPLRREAKARAMPVNVVTAACKPDGVAITSQTALRYAVTQLDVTLERGHDVLGNKVSPQGVRELADGVAREFAAPDVMLEMLDACAGDLIATHPHGYWMLSSALVREASRRRAEGSLSRIRLAGGA